MTKSLIQRIGTGIVLAGIGTGLISGCANEGEAMMGSLIGTMGLMSPTSTPGDAMVYAGMRDASQNSLNSMNAKKSRTVVINNGQTPNKAHPAGDIPGVLYDERGIPTETINFRGQWIGWDEKLYAELAGYPRLFYYDTKYYHAWKKSGYKINDTYNKSLFPRCVQERTPEP